MHDGPRGQGSPVMGPFIIQVSQSPMCWFIQSVICPHQAIGVGSARDTAGVRGHPLLAGGGHRGRVLPHHRAHHHPVLGRGTGAHALVHPVGHRRAHHAASGSPGALVAVGPLAALVHPADLGSRSRSVAAVLSSGRGSRPGGPGDRQDGQGDPADEQPPAAARARLGRGGSGGLIGSRWGQPWRHRPPALAVREGTFVTELCRTPHRLARNIGLSVQICR